MRAPAALLLLGLAAGCPAVASAAETVVAARTLRAQTLITAGDLQLQPGATPGAIADPAQAIGREARVVLYAGRPIRPADLGAPALVERNDLVVLAFAAGGLAIRTEGRALGRAGAGEAVQVMNLGSKTIVTGRVAADGTVRVGPPAP
jgi:flagella basal body P-ring formation protein FlgA